MKGIILAGGSGSRLNPLTKPCCKQLLPVYNKPMIYYPLSLLMLIGIKEILIITTTYDLPMFQKLLDDGNQWGINLNYATQQKPRGLAEALIIGEQFIDSDSCCLILGDNILYGQGLVTSLQPATRLKLGAQIFAYYVQNPEAYGVVEFDQNGTVLSLEEKPVKPKSNYAVPGIYFYDKQAVKFAKNLQPSSRGELEITDLNREYLSQKLLKVSIIGRGTSWLDAGTFDSLLEASNFVRTIEKRQGLKIACLEEIAFRQGFISLEQLIALTDKQINSDDQEYLEQIINLYKSKNKWRLLPSIKFLNLY